VSSPLKRQTRPQPDQAIDARRRDSAAKLAAVSRVVKLLGRSGVPVTRATVVRLAGVSRSFTYENRQARTIIDRARSRSEAQARTRSGTVTAQEEASWRERALHAEDYARQLRKEVALQRRLVSDLTGQLREPDGTWIERDRDRLRLTNEALLAERNQLVRERHELRRKLEAARSNVSRLLDRRVTELYPNGPGRK
jgi:signal transduction histidine kinase